MRLLVSRPAGEAARTAAALAARGHAALVAPMLAIEPVAATPPEGAFDALAVTSANGARRLAELGWPLPAVPVFAVGARTAAALRDAGFADVTTAEGDVAALAARIAARLPRGARVLWVAGADRAGDLAAALRPHGMAVVTAVVYRAVAAQRLPADVATALRAGALDGALHFSPRTAAALLAAADGEDLGDAMLTIRHYALSDSVAAPLRARRAAVAVAAEPTEAALLALIGKGAPAGAMEGGPR